MGELVEAAKAFSEPITKFIDVVSRGIGCIFEPTKIKKLADAKAYEISTIADAVRKNDDLPIFIDRDGVQIDSTDFKALAERTSSRLMLQEMRKQQNIEAIVNKAYEELQKETEVSGEPVDDDWIVRFFNSVEGVSNEEMRTLWGKILADEIKKPKSFSARTLDNIKNMSTKEAQLFQWIMSYSVELCGSVMLLYDIKSNRNFEITYDELRTLDECGLIDLLSIMNRKIDLAPNHLIELESEGLLFYISNEGNTSERINLTSVPLTITGKELYCIIDKKTNISGLFNLIKSQELKKSQIRIKAFVITTNTQGQRSADMSNNVFSWE